MTTSIPEQSIDWGGGAWQIVAITLNIVKIASDFDQEIPQSESQTAV